MNLLTTRRDYNRASEAILKHLAKHGPTSRSTIAHYQQNGIPSTAIYLALIGLEREGKIELLFTVGDGNVGARKTYYALPGQAAPEGTLRAEEALSLIGE